ncbi:MAG: response regulator [Planctomycetota bacterium]
MREAPGAVPSAGYAAASALLLAFPLLVALGLGLGLVAWQERASLEQDLVERQSDRVEQAARRLEVELLHVARDLRFLSQGGCTVDALAGRGSRASAERELLALCQVSQGYAQLRLLDPSGRERVRVERGPDGPQVRPEPALQDKSGRYYVEAGLELPPRGIYVSPLDLNVERGQVEDPPNPMLRLVAPVDAGGERLGLVVLNLAVGPFLEALRGGDTDSPGLWLINDRGHWLVGPSPEVEWSFMRPEAEARGLFVAHPEAFAQLSWEDRQAQDFATWDGLYSTRVIRPAALLESSSAPVTGSEAWAVVSRTSGAALDAALAPWRLRWGGIALTLAAAVLGGAWVSTRQRLARRAGELLQREREAQFRDLLLAAPDAVIASDSQGQITFANERALELTGYSRPELLALDVEALVPPALREAHRAHRARFLEARRAGYMSTRANLPLLRKDGVEVPTEIVLSLLETPWGARVLSAVRDVSARLAAEARIRELHEELEQRYAELAEGAQQLQALNALLEREQETLDRFFHLSPDLFLIASADGELQRVSRGWGALLGRDEAAVLRGRLLELVHPDDRDEVQRALIRADGERVSFECRAPLPDPPPVWLAWSAVAVEDRAQLYAVVRDVSARRQDRERLRALAEELQCQTEELRSQGEELRAQREQLAERNVEVERASRSKSEFLANMSHELRTPLNSIIGFSELLLEREQHDRETQEQVETIRASGQHLLELINDILDLSRIEAGRMLYELEPLVPRDVLEQALVLVRPLSQAKQISCRLEARASALLRGDRARVRQILVNLLSNALKFSPEGSTVELGAEEHPAGVRLWVADEGPGIPAGLRPSLFEPFVQGEDPLVKHHEGTGLGLAISKRLAQGQGGILSLEERAQGACFSLVLPRWDPTERESGAGAPAVTPQRPLILLVAETRSARRTLQAWLLEAGYDVVEARSVEDAAELRLRLEPQALVVDGAAALAECEHPGLAGLPRLQAPTLASGDPALVPEDVFPKPLDRAALLRRLSAVAEPVGSLGSSVVLLIDDDPHVSLLLRPILESAGYELITGMTAAEGLRVAQEREVDVAIVDLKLPDRSGFEVIEELERDPRTRGLPLLVLTGLELAPEERERLRRHVRAVAEKGDLTRDAFLAALESALAPASAPVPTQATVLVVDDHAPNRKLVATILLRSGYGVLEAEDGAEALEIVARERPALILMDLAMPGMDGYAANRALKASDAADIPVVAVTARVQRADQERVEAEGFADYVPKPLDKKRLLDVVRRYTDRGEDKPTSG